MHRKFHHGARGACFQYPHLKVVHQRLFAVLVVEPFSEFLGRKALGPPLRQHSSYPSPEDFPTATDYPMMDGNSIRFWQSNLLSHFLTAANCCSYKCSLQFKLQYSPFFRSPMSESTIACLLVTHLPLKSERQRYPSLRGKPVVIVERRRPGGAVMESSPEAQGVEAGMPLEKALIRCPQAVVLEADRGFYDDVFDRMAEALAMRCPAVGKGRAGLPLRQAGRHSTRIWRRGAADCIPAAECPACFRAHGWSGPQQVPGLRVSSDRQTRKSGQGNDWRGCISPTPLHRTAAHFPGRQESLVAGRNPHPGQTGGHDGRRSAVAAGFRGPARLAVGPRNRPQPDAGTLTGGSVTSEG